MVASANQCLHGKQQQFQIQQPRPMRRKSEAQSVAIMIMMLQVLLATTFLLLVVGQTQCKVEAAFALRPSATLAIGTRRQQQEDGNGIGVLPKEKENANNHNIFWIPSPSMVSRSVGPLFGKKDKRKGGGSGGGGSRSQQPVQEKQSVKDARFDAVTRQFMFTMVGLTKILPDKSKQILKNIHLSFYPGAKIGVVGLNGSGTCVQSNAQLNATNFYLSKYRGSTLALLKLLLL